jgi:hypothetical protein
MKMKYKLWRISRTKHTKSVYSDKQSYFIPHDEAEQKRDDFCAISRVYGISCEIHNYHLVFMIAQQIHTYLFNYYPSLIISDLLIIHSSSMH